MDDKDMALASDEAPGCQPSASAAGASSQSGIPSADWRDASDLSGFPWPFASFAPGDYMGKCQRCGDTVIGISKRSRTCLRCAMSSLAAEYDALDRAFRIRVWNDAKTRGLSDRAAMEEIKVQRAAASAMSGSAQDAQRLDPKDASAVRASADAKVQP